MEKDKAPILVPMLSGVCIGIAISFLIVDSYLGTLIARTIFLGFVTALASFFLQFCYKPGNIFGGYMDWLEKNFRDNPKNPFAMLFNPLGGCAYCQNIWVGFFFFLTMNLVFGIGWWILLPMLFVAHLMLNVLDQLFWQ